MVTITDIARRLGVAVSTVSKGLNGANDVSESTRALILKTAVEMGYAGRKVQKSDVRKVCVLAEREEFLSAGQFGYDLAMGFRTAAAQNGWQADLAPFQGLLASQESLDIFLLRHNYAGAFLIKQPLDFFQSNYLKTLINPAFPLVFWEEESNGPGSGSVGSDHRRGVFMALEHLCQLGHKRIALLNGLPDFPLSGLWASAYRDALEVLQLTYHDALYADCRGEESVRPFVDRLLSFGATAVLCAGSQLSSSVLACLRAMGRRIPEEISVLGLSGRLEASEKKEPFTVVRQDSLSLGRAAFYMLEGLRNKIPMGRLLLRPQLILRDTTGPCARHL